MKCAAAIMLVLIAFASQALAVLRPLFPAKATPPLNDGAMIIENDAVQRPAKQAPATAPK